MSAMTTEWQKTGPGANSVKYTVVMENFRHKMKTFKPGRSIWSKDFKVGRSIFCLGIFPSGEKKNSSGVGVYLHNKSDWDVFADVRFQVGGCMKSLQKQRFGKVNSGNEN